MKNIERYILNLDWSNPEEVQNEAIDKLVNASEEEVILLTRQSNELCHKGCWHNAAKVLQLIGYPGITYGLPYLMEWFQDVNWPGVAIIVDILKGIEQKVLIPYIRDALSSAVASGDEEWLFGIRMLISEIESVRPLDISLVDAREYINNCLNK